VGGILAVLGAALLARHRALPAGVALGLGGALLALAALRPALLSAPHRAWLALAKALGRVNSAVFLTITFFLVLTPLGLVLRLFGRDELRRRGAAPASMWTPYSERNRDPRHYETIW
jgi:hypothetical protein